MPIDYETLLNATSKEMTEKVKSKELVVPPKGDEREEFFKFASLEPGSDERKAFFKQEQQEPQSAEQEPVAPETPPSQTEVPPETPPEKPTSAEEPSDSPKWEDLGYESPEEAKKALELLQDTAIKQKQHIDRLNAKNGQMGRELKEHREKLKPSPEPEKPREPEKPKAEPKAERPKRPQRPDPASYEDGAYDEKYFAAVKDYDKQMGEYEENYEKYLLSIRPEPVQDPRYEALEEKVNVAHEYVQTNTERDEKDSYEKSWGNMWSDVEGFQKEFGLNTTASAREIDGMLKVINNQQATPAERQTAQGFVDALPKQDKDNWQKLIKAIYARYDFSNDVPVAKYKTWRGALQDNDMTKEFNSKKEVPISVEEQKQLIEKQQSDDSVQVPSASQMPAGDEKLVDQMADDDVRKEFDTLQREMRKNLPYPERLEQWKKSPKFKRYVQLRNKLGIGLSSGLRKDVASYGVL